MAFITQTDLEVYIDQIELDQISNGNTNVIPEAIKDAEEYSAEMLRQRYDMAVEYAKTGDDRNRQLLKNTTAIAIYYINQRIPTNVQPEARAIAYEDAVNWLKEVAAGLRMVDMEQLDAENSKGYAIRWGSKTKSNDNFL